MRDMEYFTFLLLKLLVLVLCVLVLFFVSERCGATFDRPPLTKTIYTSDNPESATTIENWVKSLVGRSFRNRTANNYFHSHSRNTDFVMILCTEMQSAAHVPTREIGLYFRVRARKLKVTTLLKRVQHGQRSHVLLCRLYDIRESPDIAVNRLIEKRQWFGLSKISVLAVMKGR